MNDAQRKDSKMNFLKTMALLLCLGGALLAQGPTYPGNATDFTTSIEINGTLNTTASRVITVNALDTVRLIFDSPNGGTYNQAFSAFYQLMFTGTALSSAVIPGETPPGGFWLDTSGSNLGVITPVVPYLDGLNLGGPNFLNPILLSGGYSYAFAVPPSLGGQGASLMLQAVIAEPGLNGLNLGIDSAIELIVN